MSDKSRKRWGVAAAASASVCILWFAYLNRDGCWLYVRGTDGLILFLFPWLWLVLLFGFKVRGKLALVALTLLGLLFWPHIDSVAFAAAESRTVATLRQMHLVLESSRTNNSYPRRLPTIDSLYSLGSAYRFEYVPSVLPDGTVYAYVIKATPLRRVCGCTRSFTIADDGRLFYTLEERAATVSDPVLQ